jgi:hypothetical protein
MSSIKVTIEVMVDNTTITFEEEISYLSMSSLRENQVNQAQQLFHKGIMTVDKALESQK